jgi:hypothetical protein
MRIGALASIAVHESDVLSVFCQVIRSPTASELCSEG